MKKINIGDSLEVATSKLFGNEAEQEETFYNTRSAIKLIVILSLALAWIPYVGLMVAGYIGGKRAGSLWRGLFAVAVSSAILIAFTCILNLVLLQIEGPEYILGSKPTSLSDVFSGGFGGLINYFASFSIIYNHSIIIGEETFAILVAAALIGGIMVTQERNDTHQIVVTSIRTSAPNEPLSIQAHKDGVPMGFITYEHYSNLKVNTTTNKMLKGSKKSDKALNEPAVNKQPKLGKVEVTTTEIQPEVPVNPISSGTTITSTISDPVPEVKEAHVDEPKQNTNPEPEPKKQPVQDNGDDLDWF